jgi:membrane fusion protein (multidrug efflux system)
MQDSSTTDALPLLNWGAVGIAVLAVLLPLRSSQAQGFPPAAVIVAEALEQRIEDEISVIGTVQPRHASLIASETEGVVVDRRKDRGQTVRPGEILLQLDNDQLRASLIEALADVELREFDYTQSEELVRQEAAAEQELRQAKYELARARAKLRDIRNRLDNLAVRAPFGGHIIETFTELGEWVGRGDGIARLIATDTIRVASYVPERFVDLLQRGDGATVYIEALGTDSLSARIVAILAEGSPQSHTFPVVVEVLNPDGRIRSNMAARTKFRIRQPKSVLLVHKDAIVNTAGGTVVYVAQDEVVAMRSVKTGMSYQGLVAVQGDLEPGDLVVVRGNERLRDGQAVRVIRKQQ